MRRLYADMRRQQSGQTLVEYAVLYIGVIVPLTFGILYLAQMLWVWHSVVDFTRDGARYAATHCWQSDGQNVISYMQSHVPLMIDMDQFQQGQAVITVNFYAADPTSGELTGFSCGSGDCTRRLPAGRGHGEHQPISIRTVPEFSGTAAGGNAEFSGYPADRKQRMRSGAGSLFAVRGNEA